ncbi:S-adenosyl-L-methionine-dependent methyltransferase [Halenospora varia]|nr:S-adenosyl-L-methionine-dependent methyltransferase [Halenospora varia]
MFSNIFDIPYHLVDPLRFMCLAAAYIPGTVISLIAGRKIGTLLSPSAFKDAWFARFWGVYGPLNRENSSPNVAPLIAQAHGIVLDIGPGNGEWVSLFDKEKVTKIYGVEPNVDHHVGLRKRIQEAGLEDKYIILPVGIEDLGTKSVKKESVDSVITIHCLCSIPAPRFMINELYGYIKEGGCWIVYEHVKVKEGRWVAPYQSLVDFIWPHFLGGCSITRDTEKWLKAAGAWSKVELKQPEGEPVYQVIPHIKGILVK